VGCNGLDPYPLSLYCLIVNTYDYSMHGASTNKFYQPPPPPPPPPPPENPPPFDPELPELEGAAKD
jgi:hypothetical protein